jgi:hypothetical protein
MRVSALLNVHLSLERFLRPSLTKGSYPGLTAISPGLKTINTLYCLLYPSLSCAHTHAALSYLACAPTPATATCPPLFISLRPSPTPSLSLSPLVNIAGQNMGQDRYVGQGVRQGYF